MSEYQCDKSVNSNTKTTLYLKNNTSQTVNHFWRNYEGNEVAYGPIKAGGSVKQETYATHPWVLRDADDNSVVAVLVLSTGQNVTVAIDNSEEWGS